MRVRWLLVALAAAVPLALASVQQQPPARPAAAPWAATSTPGDTRPPEGPPAGPLPGWGPHPEAQAAIAKLDPALRIKVVSHGFGDGLMLYPELQPHSVTDAVFVLRGLVGDPHATVYYVVGFAPYIRHVGTDGVLLPDVHLLLPLVADANGIVEGKWPTPWPAGVESWHQMVFSDSREADGWRETNVVWVRSP